LSHGIRPSLSLFQLHEEQSLLVQKIDELKKLVESLWERLETPTGERNKFLQKCSSQTPKVALMVITSGIQIFASVKIREHKLWRIKRKLKFKIQIQIQTILYNTIENTIRGVAQ